MALNIGSIVVLYILACALTVFLFGMVLHCTTKVRYWSSSMQGMCGSSLKELAYVQIHGSDS